MQTKYLCLNFICHNGKCWTDSGKSSWQVRYMDWQLPRLNLHNYFLFGGLAIKVVRLSQAGELIELAGWDFLIQYGNANGTQFQKWVLRLDKRKILLAVTLLLTFKATSTISSLYFFCQLLTEQYPHIIKLYNAVYWFSMAEYQRPSWGKKRYL